MADSSVRISFSDPISDYSSITITNLAELYRSNKELFQMNSFTFDDSANIGPDCSLTVETMDATMFTRYLSDSTF